MKLRLFTFLSIFVSVPLLIGCDSSEFEDDAESKGIFINELPSSIDSSRIELVGFSQDSKAMLYVERFLDLPPHGMVEGLAIHNNTCFSLSDRGLVRVIELMSGKIIYNGKLGTFSTDNHANTAAFSNIMYDENDSVPLLYVSKSYYPTACYVERFLGNRFETVQTINVKINGFEEEYCDFAVDTINSELLCTSAMRIQGRRALRIRHFKLPEITDSTVQLTEKDIIEEQHLDMGINELRQGSTFYDGYLYYLFGGYSESHKYLVVIDIKTLEYRKYDLSFVPGELEDVSIYKGMVIISKGDGGLWHVYKKNYSLN